MRQYYFSSVIGIILLCTGCGSGSDSSNSSGTVPTPLPSIAAAQEDSEFFQLVLSPNQESLTTAYTVEFIGKNQNLSPGVDYNIFIAVDNAVLTLDNLPPNCTNNATEEIVDELILSSIVCTVDSQEFDTSETIIDLPVEFPIFQETSISLSTRVLDSFGNSIETMTEHNFQHIPEANTGFDSNGLISEEIIRLLRIANGSSFDRIVHPLNSNQVDCEISGSQIITDSSDGFPTHKTLRYENCLSEATSIDMLSVDPISINGEVTFFQGRNSIATTIDNADISVGLERTDRLLGKLSWLRSDATQMTLDGTHTSNSIEGIETVFTIYQSNCIGTNPMPKFVLDPMLQEDYIETGGLIARYQTDDNILGGENIDVELEAFQFNRAAMTAVSDNGSTLRLHTFSGEYPAIILQMVMGDVENKWVLPWDGRYSISCTS